MRARDPLVRVPCLYHFTGAENCLVFVNIRDVSNLREKGYEFVAGGNDWSLEQDQRFGMDHYVHLCWTRGLRFWFRNEFQLSS